MLGLSKAVTDRRSAPDVRVRILIFTALILLTLLALTVASREASAEPRARGKLAQRGKLAPRAEGALESIDAVRLRKLAQSLDLDPEQRRLMADAFTRGLIKKRNLLNQRMQILDRMRKLAFDARPGDIEKIEPEMRQLVAEFRRVEREIVETEWATQDEIFSHLAPDQELRCILFNEGFDRRVRVLLGPFWQRE